MKRAAAAARTRVHRVWIPLIDAIFAGSEPPACVAAEARMIERQLAMRNRFYQASRVAPGSASLPLFEDRP